MGAVQQADYCDTLGLPVPKDRVQKYGTVKWMCIRRDHQSAVHHWRKGELTFKEWRCSLRGKKVYALFSWADPGPFLGDLIRSVRLYLKPEEREKRNYCAS